MESLQAGFCLLITLICSMERRRVSTWQISFTLKHERNHMAEHSGPRWMISMLFMNQRTVSAINYISRTRRMHACPRLYLPWRTLAHWHCPPPLALENTFTPEIVSKYKPNNSFVTSFFFSDLCCLCFPCYLISVCFYLGICEALKRCYSCQTCKASSLQAAVVNQKHNPLVSVLANWQYSSI